MKPPAEQADAHTLEADKKLADYEVAPAAKRADLIVDGIDELVAALQNDPFNAKATLKLALAYDKVANRRWFAGYRKEAVRAIGRPGHP